MGEARLKVDIERRLGPFRLQVKLEVGTEVLVLFGPSGAGKTQTLHAIAGLATPDRGEITFDGEVFFRRGRPGPAVNLPARRRRVGYVFQDYALFPHLTALENVAYPLWGRRDARQRAMALLERMRLAHVAHHYPHQLSGGQKQRVAIARALAGGPQLLLMDEPFSALDIAARERLQGELRELQADLGLVVVYVTHNLEDAFAVGHRLAVVQEGRVEQVGPVEEVFRNPASDAVLEILGVRNIIRARVVEATAAALWLDWDGLTLEAPPAPHAPGERVTAYIHPESIKLIYPDRPLTRAVRHNQVTGRIVARKPNAASLTLRVALPNGHQVEVRFPPHSYLPLALSEKQEVLLSLRKEGLVVLRAPGGNARGA